MDNVYTHNKESQQVVIEYGHYAELVNSKHERAYGTEGRQVLVTQPLAFCPMQ